MAKAICQHALDRVMAYLRGHDIAASNDVCRMALEVVDAALSEGSEEVMVRAMDKIPEFFDLPEAQVPPQVPPLDRGSIGYWSHV